MKLQRFALLTAVALTATGTPPLAAQVNDPFVAEELDFGPVSPAHYKTFQWHLGFSNYGPYNDIQVAGAWQFNPGHAYLGVLDGGVSTFTGSGSSLVVAPPHEDLADNHGDFPPMATRLLAFLSEWRVYHFNDTSRFSAVRLGGDNSR